MEEKYYGLPTRWEKRERKEYSYQVQPEKIDALMDFCKRNALETDSGYAFGDCFQVNVICDDIHDRIIKRLIG